MNQKKAILITGGTSGIGKALVEYFDRSNKYQVYFTARSEEKAKELNNTLNNSQYFLMDFAHFESVVEAASLMTNQLGKLDILINNAGTWQMEFKETQNQIEMNFAVNHLAPMLLTLELLPILQKSTEARIINTSSGAHRRNILNFEDLEYRQQEYNGVATYSQSKLCNILFSLGLVPHLKNTDITVNTVHPGYVQSDLFNNMGSRNWDRVPSAEHGARSAIYVAEALELQGVSGKYYYLESEDKNLSSLGKDTALAQQLWKHSMDYLKPYLSAPLSF